MGAKRKIVTCTECGEDKVHGAKGLCRTCYHRQWKDDNREHRNHYERVNRKQLRDANPEKYRKRAKAHYQSVAWAKRILSYSTLQQERSSISLNFLSCLQTNTITCPCCGVALNYEATNKRESRPSNIASLDRIIPELGYTENNVAIICIRCNRLKNNMTLDELEMLITYIKAAIHERTDAAA